MRVRSARAFLVTAPSLLLALVVCAAAASSARAAEVTRVASSFEVDAPFGANAWFGFGSSSHSAQIHQEVPQADANGFFHTVEVPELSYAQTTTSLPFRAAVGLYHDLQLTLGTALVLKDNRSWNYASGVTDASAPLRHSCVGPRADLQTSTCSANNPLGGGSPLFDVPGNSYRAGLDNFTIGLSWAAFNEEKQPGVPTWVVGLEYVAPTANLASPSLPTSASSPGGIGDKVRRFNISSAVSKRVGNYFDPYFKINYSIPSASPSAYNNCDNPSNEPIPEFCGTGPWTRAQTGVKPQHIVNAAIGTEVVPWQDGVKRKVGLDLQLGVGYFSEGRLFNELSDALGRALYTDDYAMFGGSLGAYVRITSFALIRFDTSLYFETDHFLTDEQIGIDVDGQCKDPNSTGGCVDLGSNEVNPNFDARYDMPGRRFRITRSKVFSLAISGMVNW